jgi:hypothetical protein
MLWIMAGIDVAIAAAVTAESAASIAAASAAGAITAGTLVAGAVNVGIGLAVSSALSYGIQALAGSPTPPEGTRINDIPVQSASEGTGMHYLLGSTNRVAGTIIWLSDLIEVRVRQNVGGGKGGTDNHSSHYDYYVHVAIAVCEGPITGIDKIWANEIVIYDSSVTPPNDPRAHLVRIYTGTGGQAQDSLIESFLGVGKTPAFRNTAYVVIEGLYLRDFGDALPQFNFLVKTQTHESVSGGLSNLLERQGLSFAAGDYNVDNVDHSIRGMVTTGPMTGIQTLQILTQGYDVLVQETNNQLVFFTRGRELAVNVTETDLNAHDGVQDTSTPRPLQFEDSSGFDLPQEVDISYFDPTTDYQTGSQRYQRNDANTNQVLQINLPLVLAPKEAVDLAANRLWRGYSERQIVSFALPPHYITLEENDIAVIPSAGQIYNVRMFEINRGANYLLQCKGVLVSVESADEAVECNQGTSQPPELIVPPPIDAVLHAGHASGRSGCAR